MQIFKYAYFHFKYEKLYGVIKFIFLCFYLLLVFAVIDGIHGLKHEINTTRAARETQVRLLPIGHSLSIEELKTYGASDLLEKAEYEGSKYLEESKVMLGTSSSEEEQFGAVMVRAKVQSAEVLAEKMEKDLTAGSANLAEGECLISESNRARRNLSIGDKLVLYDGEEPITFTIKGIYKNTERWSVEEEIYLAAETLHSDLAQKIQWQAVYYLKNKNGMKAFSSEVKGKGLSNQVEITTNKELYQAETIFLENSLSNLINFGLPILFLLSVLLVILTGFPKKQQQSEIILLHSWGISKSKMIFLHCSVNLLILVIAGFLAGGIFEAHFSNKLIQLLIGNPMSEIQIGMTPLANAVPAEVVNVVPITEIVIQPVLSIWKAIALCIILLILCLSKALRIKQLRYWESLQEETTK